MSKDSDKKPEDESVEMRDEYDFSQGVRGKYVEWYARCANVVVLEPDVAEVFPDSDAVNRALRTLASIIKEREQASAA